MAQTLSQDTRHWLHQKNNFEIWADYQVTKYLQQLRACKTIPKKTLPPLL